MTGTAMDDAGLPVVEPDPHAEPEPVAEAPEPTSPPPPPAAPADPAKAGILAELQEERRARRAEAERAARLEARFAEMQKRMETLNRPAEQPPPPIPNRDERPVEHFDARLSPVEQKLARFEAWEKQQAEQVEQTRQINTIVGAYRNQAQEFAQSTPDWGEAYQFLAQHRVKELMAIGHDSETARRIAENDEIAIAAKALQDGASAPQRLYEMAKLRGYQAKPVEQRQEQPRGEDGKFATLEAGAKAQGIGGAPAANPNAPKMADWANMSDADFEAEWKKYEARAKREAG